MAHPREKAARASSFQTLSQKPALDKSGARVAAMFDEIAPTYDLLNHLLSANHDRRWRTRAVRLLAPRAGETVLDLCCGTGDLTLELQKQAPRAHVLGADFAVSMLSLARRKQLGNLVAASALALPFPDAVLDAVSVGFGARNFSDTRAGLSEIRRTLRPGGRVLILEFMRPTSLLVQRGFSLFNLVLAPLGRAISGHDRAYNYLPQSVDGFYARHDFTVLLRDCGFENVRSFNYSLGISTAFIAHKPGGNRQKIKLS